jgi:hypothetical protein
MIFPPSLLRLRFRRPGRRGFGLWLPILLLWPLILIGALLTSLFAFLGAFFTGRFRSLGRSVLLGPRLLVLFCHFRRLRVHVRDDEEELLIDVT